ncbi:MAG: hypothetical protein FWD57_08750, partial [Polyangiaceae bacterium]|nr:hypothetical protein [Polyangiaceae bacterium]
KLPSMLPTWEHLFARLPDEKHGLQILDAVLAYVSDMSPTIQRDSLDLVRKMARLAPGHMPGSLAERLCDEGRQQGLQQGLQQAEERARQTLTKLLKRRFQHLPPWVANRINQAHQDQLDTWFDRVIDARDLEQVFN